MSDTPAVIYACKSSPDERESVADQHRLVRQAVGNQDRIVGVFGEQNKSGYRKERGPELERAMHVAIEAASEHGEAELWVFHSSRLARGDGTRGRRSIAKLVHDLLYQGVTVRSATDNEMVTPMLSGIASVVSNKYSADLSVHTTRGIHKRQREGKPFGTIPLGYKREVVKDADGEPVLKGNRVAMRRVVDPATAPTCELIWSMLEDGKTWGPIACELNRLGLRTQPRKDKPNGLPWYAEAVRDLAKNPLYTGQQGYPRLIEPERFEAILQLISDSTLIGQQKRKGGRPVIRSDAFLLRGISFCLACGAPMRIRSDNDGRYVCAAKRSGTGLCDAKPIPAQIADERVSQHLATIMGGVREWIEGQVAGRSEEIEERLQALDQERAKLKDLDRQREQRMAELAQIGITALGLEVIARIDQERAAVASAIADAEAELQEWEPTSDVDAMFDYYDSLVAAVHDRISGAGTVTDLNAKLSTVVGGIWLGYDGKALDASFALAPTLAQDRLPLPKPHGNAHAFVRSSLGWGAKPGTRGPCRPNPRGPRPSRCGPPRARARTALPAPPAAGWHRARSEQPRARPPRPSRSDVSGAGRRARRTARGAPRSRPGPGGGSRWSARLAWAELIGGVA
jgi:DNA invertase Pin-like site-specific DNA recombinase